MKVFIVAFSTTMVLSVLAATHAADVDQRDVPAFIPAASDHQPPRFLPGVALYLSNRFVTLQVGKTFSFTCKDALADTQTAIANALENGPPGTRAVGLCIPIPTYDPADLAEGAGEQAPPVKSEDNSL